jgi:hypothetical protein
LLLQIQILYTKASNKSLFLQASNLQSSTAIEKRPDLFEKALIRFRFFKLKKAEYR